MNMIKPTRRSFIAGLASLFVARNVAPPPMFSVEDFTFYLPQHVNCRCEFGPPHSLVVSIILSRKGTQMQQVDHCAKKFLNEGRAAKRGEADAHRGDGPRVD